MELRPHLDLRNFAPALPASDVRPDPSSKWFALYTMPQSEQSGIRHLDARAIESFLPTYESLHVSKTRLCVNVVRPLFPSYVFVRILARARGSVLRPPGALRIVGNCQGPVTAPEI